MGTIIFLTGAIIEIVFAIFCITTKSNQQKARSIIRIVAFMGFMLFVLLPVIYWDLRYYTLAILLLLLAVMGAVALIHKSKEKREYPSCRMVAIRRKLHPAF